jgi:uncharacterized integral membrane protein
LISSTLIFLTPLAGWQTGALKGEQAMQIFFIIAFVLAIGIAIFAIQNSDADMVVMRFLTWEYKTSLVYTLLGASGWEFF